MYCKRITFTDYDGNERTEDFRFNLNRAEALEWNLGSEGGLAAYIRKIIDTQDFPRLVELFKKIILKAYGEKSLDGRRFIKSEELSREFSQTEAYVNLYMELATNHAAAAEFVNGICPPPEKKENA